MAGRNLTLWVVMAGAVLMAVVTRGRANDLEMSHSKALSDTTPEHFHFSRTVQNLTQNTQIKLGNILRITECSQFECDDHFTPHKTSGTCFKPVVCVPCHNENECIVGYHHHKSCTCGERRDGQDTGNITWDLYRENNNQLCDNEPLPSCNDTRSRTLWDERQDFMILRSEKYNAKVTLKVCEARECSNDQFLVPSDKKTRRVEHFGGVTIEWDDEKCKCQDQKVERDLGEVKVTIRECNGEDVTVKLRNVITKLNEELRKCEKTGGRKEEHAKDTTTTTTPPPPPTTISTTKEHTEQNIGAEMKVFNTPAPSAASSLSVGIIFTIFFITAIIIAR